MVSAINPFKDLTTTFESSLAVFGAFEGFPSQILCLEVSYHVLANTATHGTKATLYATPGSKISGEDAGFMFCPKISDFPIHFQSCIVKTDICN